MPFHRPIPESSARPKDEGGLKSYVEAEKLLQIAFVLPSAVALGALGGYGLERLCHQKWMLIAGILLGCALGLAAVIRQAVAAEKVARRTDEAAERESAHKDQEGKPS